MCITLVSMSHVCMCQNQPQMGQAVVGTEQMQVLPRLSSVSFCRIWYCCPFLEASGLDE